MLEKYSKQQHSTPKHSVPHKIDDRMHKCLGSVLVGRGRSVVGLSNVCEVF